MYVKTCGSGLEQEAAGSMHIVNVTAKVVLIENRQGFG